jgi:GTP-binding protein
VWCISAVNREGVDELAAELMALVNEEKARAEAAPPEEVPVLRPEAPQRFEVHPDAEGRYVVEGRRVVQFVEMMDTEMEGADAEVQRRLERWGVIKALRRAGAEPGAKVVFGDVELEFEG